MPIEEWILKQVQGDGNRSVGPVKRSVTIAGHSTSISLEPIFWDALTEAAAAQRLPLSAIVARIDADRIRHPAPANLASAIRVWLYQRAVDSNAND